MLNNVERKVRTMEYPAMAGPGGAPVTGTEPPAALANRVRELESRLQERERQFAQELEMVRQRAQGEGRQQAGGEQSAWRQQCGLQLKSAIEEFRTRTDEYLGRVEREVVRLALAIAERILHREAQLDPLLLSGAVRVALGQLAETTEVRLKVPATQQDLWAEMVRLMPGLPLRPEVCADEKLQACDLVMESTLGSVDLGVRAQLGEIERGFFDLLDVRRDAKGDGAGPTAGGKQAAAGKQG